MKSHIKHGVDGAQYLVFWCQGCNHPHVIPFAGPVYEKRPMWGFNGNTDRPTLTPSVLNRSGSFADPNFTDPPEIPPTICHLFLTDGILNFLNDCTHACAGQNLPLTDLPDGYVD